MHTRDKRRLAILLAFIIVVPLGLYLVLGRQETDTGYRQETTTAKTVTWQGKEYVHRSNLSTILVMGVDRNSDAETTGYRSGGQADVLLLLVMDPEEKTVRQLQIDRDTMADITVLSILGKEAGTRNTQICLSHGFGHNEEERCSYTVKAVEGLLQGEKPELYLAFGLDSISRINDSLGGVTVTIEDDMTAYDSTMTVGSTLRLQGKQAEIFVRSRYNIADGSNAARQSRQRQFLSAASELLRGFTRDEMGSLVDDLSDVLTTNMSRGRIINEFWKAKDYTVMPVEQLEGEYTIGSDGYVEFHADPDSLQEWVLSAFYKEK